MKFVHEVTVSAPVDEVSTRLRDAEHSGSLRVRVAGAQITYRGTVRIAAADAVEHDAPEHRLTVHVAATEARGDGAVTATAELVLAAAGRPKVKTKATADIDLAVSGRAAAADEAALGETSRRLLRDLVAGPRVVESPSAATPLPEPPPELVQRPVPAASPASAPAQSGPSVRVAAVAALAVLLLLLLRRRRRRR